MAPAYSCSHSYFRNKARSFQRLVSIGRFRKKLPGPLFCVLGNLYGFQIGRIRNINTHPGSKNRSRNQKIEKRSHSSDQSRGGESNSPSSKSSGDPIVGSVKRRQVQSPSARQQEEKSSERTNGTKRTSRTREEPNHRARRKCQQPKSRRSIAGRGSYPEPGQALKQVPKEIKHSDKSAGRIRQPDPTAPPEDRQSVQVAQENKKRRQHSAQDTSDVPQQFHQKSVSKPRKEPNNAPSNYSHRIHPDHLGQQQN